MRLGFFMALVFLPFLTFSLTPQEKSKIVKTIYHRIHDAERPNDERPTFYFDLIGSGRIAYYKTEKDKPPLLGFDEKAFDICAEFGDRRDDAIAYIIGHELSHHFYAHNWGSEFRSTYAINNLEKEVQTIDKSAIKLFETQADEKGGIMCYLAGYNVLGLSEQLLDKLYTAYKIDPNHPNYPTLQERKAIALEQEKIVTEYIQIFESGNYCMLMYDFNTAINRYTYLLQKGFKSREILNNLGMSYFIKGLKTMGEDQIVYVYPIEIDLESRVKKVFAGGHSDYPEQGFERALEYFEKAIAFDKTYSTAHLNAACALSVLGEFQNALGHLDSAEKKALSENSLSTLDNIKLVRSLIHLVNPEGNKEYSKSLLQELVAKKHTYSLLNQQIIDGKTVNELKTKATLGWMSKPPTNELKNYEIFPIESIEGIDTVAKLFDSATEYRTFLSDLNESADFISATYKSSKVHFVYSYSYDLSWCFHSTESNYTGASAMKIKIGNTESDLLKKYGAPSAVYPCRQGSIYHFRDRNVFFVVDQNQIVTGWTIAFGI